MSAWIPDWVHRLPLLSLLRDAWPEHAREWPTLPSLQLAMARAGVVNHAGHPVQLTAYSASSAMAYERSVFDLAQLPVRENNWHDFFNVLAWMMFPRAKAALNAAHCLDRGPALSGRRSRRRDKLTLFDESGVIVLTADPALAVLLRGFRWRELFWQRRNAVLSAMRFLPFGHGLCEKALSPYIGMTAQALLLPVSEGCLNGSDSSLRQATDERLAALFTQDVLPEDLLTPLPLLGIPGWHADNAQETFYDNTQYFRAARSGSPAVLAGQSERTHTGRI